MLFINISYAVFQHFYCEKKIMKKLILTVATLATLPAASVIAAQNNVGCGLGSMVWEGKSGMVPQVLAVTTNNISGNQTFGITSGTLGCTPDGVVTVPANVALFTDQNLDKLARDMAVGEGETLYSLADLMKVKAQDKLAFFNTVKSHFAQIFPHEKVTSTDVLLSLNGVLAADPVLKRYSYS